MNVSVMPRPSRVEEAKISLLNLRTRKSAISHMSLKILGRDLENTIKNEASSISSERSGNSGNSENSENNENSENSESSERDEDSSERNGSSS